MLEFVAQNEPACVPQLRRHVRDFLHSLRVDPSTTYDILLATDEAAANAVAHGQAPGGNGLVRLRCSTDGACVVVAISDEGRGFDPTRVGIGSLPRWTSQGGRGLFLVQELMDEVHIDASKGGTVIEMKRHVDLPRTAASQIPEA
ncbi:MAG TPA: ATP-binding protein [Actinomycetota bacterium]|nr:ATP-binding protein [Actinomycetota bacterium]